MEKEKTARVRIWSGHAFWDFYTVANGARDWAENKMMEMEENDPAHIYDRYELLPDDRD